MDSAKGSMQGLRFGNTEVWVKEEGGRREKLKGEKVKEEGGKRDREREDGKLLQFAVHVYLLYVGWSNIGLSSFRFTIRTVTGVGTLLRGVRPLSNTVSSRLV